MITGIIGLIIVLGFYALLYYIFIKRMINFMNKWEYETRRRVKERTEEAMKESIHSLRKAEELLSKTVGEWEKMSVQFPLLVKGEKLDESYGDIFNKNPHLIFEKMGVG